AVSRLGLETILDSGYEYIVSGDFSTHDYEAKNKEELLALLMNGMLLKNNSIRQLENGSIAVMHMSDESQYTAEAIDEFLTKNQSEKERDQYTFARLSDYLKKETKKD
ncbi:MAG: polysaccharide deacetylase family protein, partial [Clostridia bacterium]|nr:polysaccharide deacetylase family protein [Clostridia bacterium]